VRHKPHATVQPGNCESLATCGFDVPREERRTPVKNKLYFQRDWYQVVGERVQIRLGDQIVRSGLVEAVTLDDGILWIAASGGESRALYERALGYSVWIEYKWETLSQSA
jgi:hypothetical protein